MRGRLGHTGGALAAAVVLVLGSAGCGGDDAGDLAALAPPDAPLYVELVVRPDGEQAEAVDSIAERAGGISDPGAALTAAVDAELADDGLGLTYADDVEPWLGKRAAVFVRSFEPGSVAGGIPDFALMLQTTDPDAAGAFVDRLVDANPAAEQERSYRGVDYFVEPEGAAAVGLVDDVLVLGSEMSFKVAVDASDGQSLDASEEWSARSAALGDDLLATASIDPAAVIQAGIASEDIDPRDLRLLEPMFGGPLSESVAIGVSATPDSATADFVALVDDERELATDASLMEALPAGSWLALAVPDLGETLARTLDGLAKGGLPGSGSIVETVRSEAGIDLRADLTGWLGDAAAFVRGTAIPGLEAGVIGQTDDPQQPRRLLEVVQRLAESESGLRSAAPPPGAKYGFSLGLPGLGGGAEAAIIGGRVVAVFGGTIADALAPPETLGDDPRFQAAADALGEDYPAAVYLDLPPLVEAARAMGPSGGVDAGTLERLAGLESVAAGSRLTDNLGITRVAVRLGE